MLQDDHRRQGEQLTEHDRDELEAGEEAAPARVGDLGEVRRAGAELATEREPLRDARRHQEEGSGDADGLVAGVQGDRQRARGHQRDGEGERRAAAAPVGVQAEHPAAQRAHQEADREDHRGRQQLRGRVVGREERAGEVDREPRVDEPVEPLDEVAEGGADDVRPHRAGAGDRAGHGGSRSKHGETMRQLRRLGLSATSRIPGSRPRWWEEIPSGWPDRGFSEDRRHLVRGNFREGEIRTPPAGGRLGEDVIRSGRHGNQNA